MSSQPPKYIIDSSAFIAMMYVYPDDVFPAVWDWMGQLCDNQTIASSEEVFEEIKKKDDKLKVWCKARSDIFLPLDETIQRTARKILIDYPGLYDAKKNKSGADPFIVATAITCQATIVTEETPTRATSTVKIPDVSRSYGLKYMSILQLMRELSFRI